eukprot:4948633-Pyramimonas_sp.AAC.1
MSSRVVVGALRLSGEPCGTYFAIFGGPSWVGLAGSGAYWRPFLGSYWVNLESFLGCCGPRESRRGERAGN